MFEKGLYLDGDPQHQPPGTYRDAEEVSLTRSPGAVASAHPRQTVASLPFGSKFLGETTAPDGRSIIFSKGTTVSPPPGTEVSLVAEGAYDQIGIFDGTKYKTLVEGFMGFDLAHPIHAVAKTDGEGKLRVYWTDGLNPPRTVVLSDKYQAFDSRRSLLFPDISRLSYVESRRVRDSGGILKTGSYYVAFRLEQEGGGVTSFYHVEGPFHVTDDGRQTFGDGAEPDKGTGKSIEIRLRNIDKIYTYVRPVLIRGSEVRLLPQVPLDHGNIAASTIIQITGGEAFQATSLDEIAIDAGTYSKAETVTQQDGHLYLGGLEGVEDVGYQPWANAISVELVERAFPAAGKLSPVRGFDVFSGTTTDQRNDEVVYDTRGFKRGEVYALYISLVYKNGTESPAYHIPGRASLAGERDGTFADSVGAATLSEAKKKFQTEPVADGSGLGYWENETEEYPDTADFDVKDSAGNVVSTLRRKKVRHHHIPFASTDEDLPFRGVGAPLSPQGRLGSEAKAVGFKLTNVRFPSEIKSKIVGYKVYFAKRGIENSRWVDQAATTPTSYDKDNESDLNAYRVFHDNSAPGSTLKYIGLAPFHSMRARPNLGTLSGSGYIRKLATATTDTFPNEEKTRTHTPDRYTIQSTPLYRRITWGGYVENNTVQSIGTSGDILYNKPCPARMILQVKDHWDWNWDIVDIFRFRTDVYRPFYAQNLAFTGYLGVDLSKSTSGEIFGGDTFIGYYGAFQATTMNVAGGGNNQGAARGWGYIQQGVYESPDNAVLRHEGTKQGQIYFPKGLMSVFRDTVYLTEDLYEENVERNSYYQNYIGYNEEYSSVNDVRSTSPLNPYRSKRSLFPNRIVRSDKEDFSSKTDSYRVFKIANLKDMDTSAGPIKKLVPFQGGLIIHCDRGIFSTQGKEELITGDVRAFIGSGDILTNDPKRLFSLDGGYAGLMDTRHSVMTRGGYFFLDARERKVYLLADGLQDVTAGVNDFLESKDFVTESNITRVAYERKDNKVYLGKQGDFCLSYILDGRWESRHSIIPDGSIHTPRESFLVQGTSIQKFGEGQEDLPFVLSVVFNGDPGLQKVFKTCLIHARCGESLTIPFDKVRVQTLDQDSGEVPTTSFGEGGNARRTGSIWKVNGLRDQADHTLSGTLPAWMRRRLTGLYHTVTIQKDERSNPVIVTAMDVVVGVLPR